MSKSNEAEIFSKTDPFEKNKKQLRADPAAPLAPEDFYYEGSNLVFTAAYHRKRGYCCNSGCRHCPFSQPSSET
jgi:hypothetical protein